MAEDAFTAYYVNVSFLNAGLSGPMAGIYNASPNEIIRIYRVGISNITVLAAVGNLVRLDLNVYRNSSIGDSTHITPVKHGKNVPDLEAVECFWGGVIVGNSPNTIRRVAWSCEEAIRMEAGNINSLGCLVEANIIFEVNSNDNNEQPIVLRPGEIFTILNSTSAASYLNSFIEFTREFI